MTKQKMRTIKSPPKEGNIPVEEIRNAVNSVYNECAKPSMILGYNPDWMNVEEEMIFWMPLPKIPKE